MDKTLNIRIEKKEQAKIKVVDIREFLRKKLQIKFNNFIKTTDNMIIISIEGKSIYTYTTTSEEEFIATIEKVKAKLL